jgi:hypothetical protein
MSADRARLTHYPPRKYREVVIQQGRALLDADSNEGQRTFTEEERHEALDFVGPCGTPDNGFLVTPVGIDFTIGPGTMYVGGLRVTLETLEKYSQQLDWLDTGEAAPWGEGLWQTPGALVGKNFAATGVWREQEITAVEDPALRDVALGGPDSAARTRLLQRVVAAATTASTCAAAAGDAISFWSGHGLIYDPSTAELKSRALLQVTLVTNPPPPSPCDPPSASGYLGVDNQMIRVLVTAFDLAKNTGTLLWGYNNASTLYRCRLQTASTLKLSSRPVSAEFQPRSGQVVQVLQRAADLGEGAYAAALTGHFAKLNAAYAPETQIVTLPNPIPEPPYADNSDVYLRLWEDQVDFTLGTAATLVGTGLQVTLTRSSAGPLHVGDHWCIAVRPTTPNAVYPERLITAAQPPDGPRMWACPLAVMQGGKPNYLLLEDCRLQFENLVELTASKSDSSCCCVTVVPSQADELQTIIDQACSSGAAEVAILLEPGTYTLRTPLIITSKHKGLVIEPCTGGKVIFRAEKENTADFYFGLILAMEGADLCLRGLDFQIPVSVPPQDLIEQELKKDPTFLKEVPKSVCFGVRAVDCDSLVIEDCYFQFPEIANSYGAGILLQADNGAVTVKRCRFFGPPEAVLSVLTGVLAAPFAEPEKDGALRPTSVNLCRVEDCLFGFISFAVLLAGEIRYLWVTGNNTRSVYGGCFLISVTPNLKLPSDLMTFLPSPALDPQGKAKLMVSQLMTSPLFSKALAVATVMVLDFISSNIEVTAQEKLVTTGNQAVLGKKQFPAIPGSPAPSLCLTLQGNQFDCRPLAGDLESSSGLFIWDTNAGSCFANVAGNTVWNRASALPTLVVVTLAGFNITGNVLISEQPAGAKDDPRALWVQPGLAVSNPKKIPVNMMTITGNTFFGGTNLSELPRQEWQGLQPALQTWEFFNAVSG